MRAFIFFSFAFFSLLINAPAQILNADRFAMKVDSQNFYQINWDLGARIKKRQDFTLSFNTRLDMAYWVHGQSLMLVGKFDLFRSGAQNFINDGFAHFRYRAPTRNRIQSEFFTQYQRDGVRGMQNRFLLGAGGRWLVYRTDHGHAYLGSALMYEYEHWDYSAVDEQIQPRGNRYFRYFKISNYLSVIQPLSPTTHLNAVLYYQMRPDKNWIYPRIALDSKITFTINKHLSFAVVCNLFYDSRPPVPVDKLYYTFTNTLSFSW